jgi:hypothetical protein
MGILLRIRQKLPASGRKIVPPENLMPISQKPVAEIAANESRRSGYKYFLSHILHEIAFLKPNP